MAYWWISPRVRRGHGPGMPGPYKNKRLLRSEFCRGEACLARNRNAQLAGRACPAPTKTNTRCDGDFVGARHASPGNRQNMLMRFWCVTLRVVTRSRANYIASYAMDLACPIVLGYLGVRQGISLFAAIV